MTEARHLLTLLEAKPRRTLNAEAQSGAWAHSVSQLQAFERCERLAAFGYVEAVPEPEKAGTDLGSRAHDYLEARFTGQGSEDHDASVILDPAWAFLPEPSIYWKAEKSFTVSIDGTLYTGRLDLELDTKARGTWEYHPIQRTRDGYEARIIDLKTSSNLDRWVPATEEMLDDWQANLYAAVYRVRTGATSVPCRWLYVGTKERRAVPRDFTIDTLAPRHQTVMAAMAKLAHHITVTLRERACDYPANYYACSDYGGCSHRARCILGPNTDPVRALEGFANAYVPRPVTQPKAKKAPNMSMPNFPPGVQPYQPPQAAPAPAPYIAQPPPAHAIPLPPPYVPQSTPGNAAPQYAQQPAPQYAQQPAPNVAPPYAQQPAPPAPSQDARNFFPHDEQGRIVRTMSDKPLPQYMIETQQVFVRSRNGMVDLRSTPITPEIAEAIEDAAVAFANATLPSPAINPPEAVHSPAAQYAQPNAPPAPVAPAATEQVTAGGRRGRKPKGEATIASPPQAQTHMAPAVPGQVPAGPTYASTGAIPKTIGELFVDCTPHGEEFDRLGQFIVLAGNDAHAALAAIDAARPEKLVMSLQSADGKILYDVLAARAERVVQA